MRCLVSSLVSLLALLCVATGAQAQDSAASTPAASPTAGGFEFAPESGPDPAVTAQGYFVYELAAGDEASGSVRLSNPGTEPVTVQLVAVDAETAQAGGSAYAAADATPTAVGRWLRPAESEVALDPGEQRSVGFTVEAPPDAAPGQYLAGIAAFVAATPQGAPTAVALNQAGASITMQTRYVIGVQIDVPGAWTPSLTITGAEALEQPSGTKLGITINNDGDTFLQPEGSVTLVNAAATPILEQPIALDTVVTGTDLTYPVAWPGEPRAGQYGVEVELAYGEGQVARYNGTLAVSEEAPAAQPAPGESEQPAVAPVPTPAPTQPPIPMWVLYAIVGLLALIAILLVAVLIRGARRRSDW